MSDDSRDHLSLQLQVLQFKFCCMWLYWEHFLHISQVRKLHTSTRAQCEYEVLLVVVKIPRLKQLVKRGRPSESLL